MARKVPLRTLGGAIDLGPPTIEEARHGLGGRASTEDRAGARVRVADARGGLVEGVVVFASPAEDDVWIGEGRFRRVPPSQCVALDRGDPALDAIEADARRFAALREGEPVRFLDRSGREREGTVVEKCRYGALVADGSRILAVSFRRVAPLASS